MPMFAAAAVACAARPLVLDVRIHVSPPLIVLSPSLFPLSRCLDIARWRRQGLAHGLCHRSHRQQERPHCAGAHHVSSQILCLILSFPGCRTERDQDETVLRLTFLIRLTHQT